MKRLDVRRASELAERRAAERWLIEGLWGESAVGIVGGEPKCCKSFLALGMAVSVAAGVPCLGRYPVRMRGPVLLYAAEDAPSIVRSRLAGICAAMHVPLDSLDVHVIVDPVVRLDVDRDRERLREEVQRAEGPLSRRELRDACRLRNATLVETLAALQGDGRVRVEGGRVQLAAVA